MYERDGAPEALHSNICTLVEDFDHTVRVHLLPKHPWLGKNLNEAFDSGLFFFSPKSFRVGIISWIPWKAALSQRWLTGGCFPC